ncbi:MAG: hypothetical protein EXQ92_10810 [Alphaproteobacteria bacterium]|nr:hypothetical protein [Alphaproteobacteria bacterium]
MFGLSISKLIVLAAVIAAVWYGFKWIGRMDKMRKEEAERDRLDNSKRRTEADRASAAPTPAAAGGAEDMVGCVTCGTFVLASAARNCGKARCPYPG